MGHPPMRLEISTGISGVEFEDCYASRIVDDFDGVTINIIDLPHLKTNKKAAGRLKDLPARRGSALAPSARAGVRSIPCVARVDLLRRWKQVEDALNPSRQMYRLPGRLGLVFILRRVAQDSCP
jgi:hypothetical protein